MKITKNKIQIFLFVVLLSSFAGKATAQIKNNKMTYAMTSVSDKGVPAPKEYFTGTVWVNMLVKPDDGLNSVIGNVTFQPNARTNWHSHPKGQILIVTNGIGYFQEKGKPIQLIQKDDVVKIPANVVHWHGASHSSSMTHIAIVADAEKESSIWLQPVTEEEYNSYKHVLANVSINLTPTAIKNHEELFPNHQSTLQKTDPELIQVFDNFAFDEVIHHDNMDTKTRVMMILASTIGSQALSEYKVMIGASLNVGITPVEIKEIVYQSVPYVGIAKAFDFIQATNEVFQSRGIKLPLEGQSTTTTDTRYDKGLDLQKEIFGSRIDDMYKNSPEDLIHIQRYLSANCFGDYVTRNGLDIKTREMVTLSILIALGGTEQQIKGHIQGNANVGNNRQILVNLLTQLLPYVGYPRTLNAINCLNEVLPIK